MENVGLPPIRRTLRLSKTETRSDVPPIPTTPPPKFTVEAADTGAANPEGRLAPLRFAPTPPAPTTPLPTLTAFRPPTPTTPLALAATAPPPHPTPLTLSPTTSPTPTESTPPLPTTYTPPTQRTGPKPTDWVGTETGRRLEVGTGMTPPSPREMEKVDAVPKGVEKAKVEFRSALKFSEL